MWIKLKWKFEYINKIKKNKIKSKIKRTISKWKIRLNETIEVSQDSTYPQMPSTVLIFKLIPAPSSPASWPNYGYLLPGLPPFSPILKLEFFTFPHTHNFLSSFPFPSPLIISNLHFHPQNTHQIQSKTQ